MRKHDVRKWLHAILDLLPVILIPVFMIYSHRHIIDSGFIDVPQNQVVDFNQIYFRNNPTVNESQGITVDFQFSQITISGTSNGNAFNVSSYGGNVLLANHTYLFRCKDLPTYINLQHNYQDVNNVSSGARILYNGSFDSVIFTNYYYGRASFYVYDSPLNNYTFENVIIKPELFDLTQMFGYGNEPTIDEFNTFYPDLYYDYTLSHKELLKGTSTITYDDTDIMSQVVYQLYNSVDKYFNMGNVFNMTGVYDWFNLNIFNGNAPISIYIVWNIVLYEFVMDLMFLLYGLFMWFIDMVEKLMEKPLKSVK